MEFVVVILMRIHQQNQVTYFEKKIKEYERHLNELIEHAKSKG